MSFDETTGEVERPKTSQCDPSFRAQLHTTHMAKQIVTVMLNS